jgi:hypothetical protein
VKTVRDTSGVLVLLAPQVLVCNNGFGVTSGSMALFLVS